MQPLHTHPLKNSPTLTDMVEAYEKEIIHEQLEKNNGNISKTAQVLGVSERILGLRVTKYGLKIKADMIKNS